MTKSTLSLLWLSAASSILLFACSKSQTNYRTQNVGNAPMEATSYLTLDPTKSPSYGDSVLFMQSEDPSAYLFRPVNQLGTGIYVSWPAGLALDEHSGVINVSESEPGTTYNVGFVNAQSGDTAYRRITIAGVAYNDGLYYLNSTNTSLQPFYFANNGGTTNLSALNGLFDEASPAGLRARDQNLLVDNATGTIDLKNSVAAGLFGPNPQNGAMKLINIYYRVGDATNGTLQRTAVFVHLYNTIQDVPAELLALCGAGTATGTESQTQVDGGGTTSTSGQTGINDASSNPPVPSPGTKTTARPPHIVIVVKGR